MSTWVRVAPRSNLRYFAGVPMLLFGVVFTAVITSEPLAGQAVARTSRRRRANASGWPA
jgi:hypothetical protein